MRKFQRENSIQFHFFFAENEQKMNKQLLPKGGVILNTISKAVVNDCILLLKSWAGLHD